MYRSEVFFGLVLSVLVEAMRMQLEQWMEAEKPYHNPDFRLDDLRQILPINNRTYLSQLINNSYGCSFFQWVNHYRLEEAKTLMSDDPQVRLADIAQSCGFSSLTVFSRTFTRYTGLTPRDWCRSCKEP
jgi:AraC-like DNA-binding protein